MRHFTPFFLCVILASCNSISRVTSSIEASHYALYQQEALFVVAVEERTVWLVNPPNTRCYVLKGRAYAEKWAVGDTLFVEDNPDDLSRLKQGKDCNHL